ncbi:V-type proton ATPase subunit E [Metallosphaera sp. J1]|uniref:V-type ATP synthase subunit E n=1 Tax=Metallosphaera javensis (ex Hofmann et al. 2022) TaxID=99938 RepID=UPI001EDEC5F7|nr:V-type ATP synthase subunit E [Metallosphaera javensis (ex Hofmann et al. 2022)]MCG3108705.1 V-type proton ATPase subunit E [Metallosphaera javensis (ex Hofmann et al. 2022)]
MVSVEELMEQVIDTEMQVISKELSKALEEALNMIKQKRDSVEKTYTAKIQDMVTKAKEEIEGERARLDIEVKRAVLSEKNYWLNKVYEGTVKSLGKVKSSQGYRQGIESVLRREARDGSIIYCSQDEVDQVQKMVKGLKVKAEVKSDPKIMGGVKIQYSDVGLVRDYSLNLILDQVFESLKPKIAEILFGEM